MASVTVVFDACVLYPAPLRDLLLRLALTDLFQARWTQQIHDEWKRNLLANRPDLTTEQIDRTQRLMDSPVRDCLVTNYEGLLPSINLPDEDDRHVVAAAIASGAAIIVTSNLTDFPVGELCKHGIQAQHPDDFLVKQFALSRESVCRAAMQQPASLRNPPKSVEAFLATLEQQRLPQTVSLLRRFSGSI